MQEEDHEAKRSSFTQLQKENIDLFWNQQLFEIQNTPGSYFVVVYN